MQTKKAEKLLRRNNFLYREFCKIAASHYKSEEYEKTLGWIGVAANFAWKNHCGLFADGRLENVALEIGKNLSDISEKFDDTDLFRENKQNSNSGGKKILHVATTVYGYGGHTRLIKNWVNSFGEFEHSLLLVNQQKNDIPNFLAEEIEKSGGGVIVLPNEAKLLEKARLARQAARQNFDYIFLHHHPSDVVPIVAFAADDCPPIALVNHADHVFFLGSSVIDLIIDFRRGGEDLSLNRRSAKKTIIVPYLLDKPQPKMSGEQAREVLGVGKDETMLITIGYPYKYKPTERYNFFATAKKIIEQNESAKLFLIGPDESQAAENRKHERMIFLGVVNDITLYQLAADIYLDGFPIGGGMASVEAVFYGVCPVFAYAPSLLSSSSLLEFEETKSAETEEEYINQVSELIRDISLRDETRKKIRARVLAVHNRDKLPEYAQAVFGYLDNIKHRPATIPDSSMKITDADKNLALLASVQNNQFPQVLETVWDENSPVNLSELLRLLALSIRANDTKVSRKIHLRAWLGTIIRALPGTAARNSVD